jgi:hypothetical protein
MEQTIKCCLECDCYRNFKEPKFYKGECSLSYCSIINPNETPLNCPKIEEQKNWKTKRAGGSLFITE